MKKSLLLAIAVISFSFAFAQHELLVQSSDKGLFLNHKVVAKESFYSIGRLYNIPPKDIAAFNGLDMNNGLAIGQSIKIPLNESNFSQTTDKGRPVYYVVGAKEGLYRVSLKNNNVLMASLRKWNKLSKDNISTGQKLIVGYLLASGTDNTVQTEPEEKKEVAPKQETVNTRQEEIINKEEPKKEEPKKADPPVTKPVTSEVAVNDGSGGYFKSQFDLQTKTQPVKTDLTASGGIFKTGSGWQDAKYYALIDHVETGTIIRITNPTNNKSIYAKVLGEMSGIRQNQGYDVRISSAAASALDISDTDKFIVKVNY
jgi:LysM repeat protein